MSHNHNWTPLTSPPLQWGLTSTLLPALELWEQSSVGSWDGDAEGCTGTMWTSCPFAQYISWLLHVATCLHHLRKHVSQRQNWEIFKASFLRFLKLSVALKACSHHKWSLSPTEAAEGKLDGIQEGTCLPLSNAILTSSMCSVNPETLYRPSDFSPVGQREGGKQSRRLQLQFPATSNKRFQHHICTMCNQEMRKHH